jgi:hypothetical protein
MYTGERASELADHYDQMEEDDDIVDKMCRELEEEGIDPDQPIDMLPNRPSHQLEGGPIELTEHQKQSQGGHGRIDTPRNMLKYMRDRLEQFVV